MKSKEYKNTLCCRYKYLYTIQLIVRLHSWEVELAWLGVSIILSVKIHWPTNDDTRYTYACICRCISRRDQVHIYRVTVGLSYNPRPLHRPFLHEWITAKVISHSDRCYIYANWCINWSTTCNILLLPRILFNHSHIFILTQMKSLQPKIAFIIKLRKYRGNF